MFFSTKVAEQNISTIDALRIVEEESLNRNSSTQREKRKRKGLILLLRTKK